MSDEKDFKEKFEKATAKAVEKNSKKLYPVSKKDIEILLKTNKESGTNSYSSDNKKMIQALKKD